MDASGRLQECGERLRGRGLRSTPQRRAILAAFSGGAGEHLSAEEVYSRAAGVMPGLGRGTVYATLAEYTEVGLLAAVGAAEPVRYETNTTQHAHFRCRQCRRILDAAAPELDPGRWRTPGQRVERIAVTVEGVCADCVAFCAGLEAGVASIHANQRGGEVRDPGAGALGIVTPVGRLVVAATPGGLARIAFPEHGDAAALGELIGRAAPAAQAHLEAARTELEAFFGDGARPRAAVRITGRGSEQLAMALAALEGIGPGEVRSYHELDCALSPRELGFSLGANPLPILGPCHRVDWGAEVPPAFVGGNERRLWLRAHEGGGGRPRSGTQGPLRFTAAGI